MTAIKFFATETNRAGERFKVGEIRLFGTINVEVYLKYD